MNSFSFLRALFFATTLLVGVNSACGQSTDELMAKGDVEDQRLHAGEALKYYLPAEKAEPKNVRLLLRIARQYRHLMADASGNFEKLRLGNVALGYAQRAVALAPNDAEAHLSVAISYGKMLPIMGSKDQVAITPKIKSEVDQAIKLDPNNDLAWHVLGKWHRVLADVPALKRTLAPLIYGKLPKGTNEEACRCFDKAIDLNPKRSMHYIELGRVYAQMGKKAEAKKMIEKGLAMPSVDKDDPEEKARGRETLEKLK